MDPLILLPYLISGIAEGGKLWLQWYIISQALQGKTRDEVLAMVDAEYTTFTKKDPATLRKFNVGESDQEG
jgi:hypothetical protein